MTQIKKYTREWFALNNGNQQQKNAIKNISSDDLDKLKKSGNLNKQTFNYDTLLGTKSEVREKFETLKQSDANKKECDLITSFGGIDNIFDIIDENGDGSITSDELASLSAIDTADWAVRDNMTLSANDLSMAYNELMRSENAKVTTEGNTISFEFKNGSSSVIETDENGDVKTHKSKIKLVNNQLREIEISYERKETVEVEYDSSGRVKSYSIDKPGTLNDKTTKTTYTQSGRTEKTDTVGRTVDVEYDTEGNIKTKSETYKYNSDGVIGNTKQHDIGDCWLLSQLTALKGTTEGAKAINEAIKKNDDGSVTVTLKGVNKSYTFTPEQVCSGDYGDLTKSYSSGDTDMKLFELAFAEWRKEQISTDHSAFKRDYSNGATLEDPLKSGRKEEVAKVLLGVTPLYSNKSNKITEFLDEKMNNDKRYALVVGFKTEDASYGMSGKDALITTNHQYSVKRVTEDTVYVINPWDSSKEIAYPREEFLSNVKDMGSVDLDKCKKEEKQEPSSPKKPVKNNAGGNAVVTNNNVGIVKVKR